VATYNVLPSADSAIRCGIALTVYVLATVLVAVFTAVTVPAEIELTYRIPAARSRASPFEAAPAGTCATMFRVAASMTGAFELVVTHTREFPGPRHC
jgi:hypothetical protein